MSNTTDEKHAVILSGGGANGAYEIGVLKALFAGKSPANGTRLLDPYIFAGTSVGSYNAAFLASRWDTYGAAAIASLEQVWLDSICSATNKPDNGIFRIRADPREFINPRSFMPDPLEPFSHFISDSAALTWEGLQRLVHLTTDQAPLLQRLVELIDVSSFIVLEPFRRLINDTVWFAEIRRTQKKLQIMATNWELGTVRILENHDMTDQLGPLAILGSAAIPGVFPPVAYGSQLFVDGGMLLNTPLNPTIDAGANVLHVISLFPNVENITLGTMNSLMATVYRQQIIGWAKSLGSNIKRVRDLNRVLKVIGFASQLIERAKDGFSAADLANLHIDDIEQHLEQYEAYTPVTVHQYFPGDDMSGVLGMLDFDRDRVKGLIDRGFEDAVRHDCEVSNCVVPAHASTPVAAIGERLLEV